MREEVLLNYSGRPLNSGRCPIFSSWLYARPRRGRLLRPNLGKLLEMGEGSADVQFAAVVLAATIPHPATRPFCSRHLQKPPRAESRATDEAPRWPRSAT